MIYYILMMRLQICRGLVNFNYVIIKLLKSIIDKKFFVGDEYSPFGW